MTTKQRAYLKSLAMTMDPIFQIGKNSMTPELTKAVEEALNARELIKVSVLQNCADDPKELAQILACLLYTSSFFIPKPFTPFQWARMYTNEEYIARAAIVKHAFQDQLNRKSLKYNWHDAEVTVLEGVFARGDRRTGKVIEEAYRLG